MAKNDFLVQLNRDYRKHQGLSPAKRVKLSGIKKLKKLEEFMKEGTVLDMFADYSDTQTGDLYHVDNVGITYILKCEDIKTLFPQYIPYGNSYLLGTSFKVTIKEIDDDGNVFLNALECSISESKYNQLAKKGSHLADHAERLKKTLFTGLQEEGIKPLVRGTVVKVERDRIFLDIFDTGLIGVVPVKNYAEQYRRDLRDIVYEGDSLKGVVFAYRARQGESEQRFLISTADYLTDAWAAARRFKVGDIIIIKCVEKPEKCPTTQKYFWGVSRMLPSIDIMSDYSTKIPNTSVVVGHYYKCKIKNIDIPRHQLKVVPFAECDSFDIGMDRIGG